MEKIASEKIKKGGRIILPVMVAALLAVMVFASLPNADSNDGAAAVGAAGDYNQGDINVINGMIDGNGLSWIKAPDNGETVDATWMSTNWPGVSWSAVPDARITVLNVSNKALTGPLNVTALTSLTELNCQNNRLTSLNVSGMSALTGVNCNGNFLTSLNASGCTALIDLSCQENDLTSLNVSGCTALVTLEAKGNLLTSLNLSNLTALEYVQLEANMNLSSINVSGCVMLNYLYLGHCNFRSFTLSGLPELQQLYLQQNNMTSLTLTDLPKLREMELNSNSFTSLTLTGLPALEILKIDNNFLTQLNVLGLPALVELRCNGNLLTSLDVSGLTNLIELYCHHNMITSLNVAGCTSLDYIDCSRNELTALDLTGCTAMAGGGLYVYENLIANIATDITGTYGSIDGTPQRVKVELSNSKSVGDLQTEIQGIIDAGVKVPYLVGTKTNADTKLTLSMTFDSKISLAGSYGGNALELNGSGNFWVERNGTLTVTALDLDNINFNVKGTVTVNGDLTGNAADVDVHVRNRGTLHVKGNVLFNEANSRLFCENGKITVNGNVTALLNSSSSAVRVDGGTVVIGGNVTSTYNAVNAQYGFGTLTIKGNVVSADGYAISIRNRMSVVVDGNVTYEGAGTALTLKNRGSLLVMGNVTSDGNGVTIENRAVVKINGTLTIGDTAWFINNEAESEFTPVSSGGYDKVFSPAESKWSVSVGKQPEPPEPPEPGGSNTLLLIAVAVVAVAVVAGAVYFFFLRPKP